MVGVLPTPTSPRPFDRLRERLFEALRQLGLGERRRSRAQGPSARTEPQDVEQGVEGGLEGPAAAFGLAEHQPALDGGEDRRGDPVGVGVGVDVARRPACGGRRRRARRATRASTRRRTAASSGSVAAASHASEPIGQAQRPEAEVVVDQRVAPGVPGLPGRQVVEPRELGGEQLLALPGRDLADQLGLAAREVVEQLALARQRRRPDPVERRAADPAGQDLLPGRLDDALAGLPTALGEGAFHAPEVTLWTPRSRTCARTGPCSPTKTSCPPSPPTTASPVAPRSSPAPAPASARPSPACSPAPAPPCVVTARDLVRAQPVVDAITGAGGTAHALTLDLAGSYADLRRFAAEATEVLGGRVDVLVNNAGIYPVGPTETLADDDLDALLAVNVRAPHVLVGALAPAMAERGDGVIVNIGSWMARVGVPAMALYPATKAALEQLTRGWAAEYGPARRPGRRRRARGHEHPRQRRLPRGDGPAWPGRRPPACPSGRSTSRTRSASSSPTRAASCRAARSTSTAGSSGARLG